MSQEMNLDSPENTSKFLELLFVFDRFYDEVKSDNILLSLVC